ncbi:hypothetical protein HJFPF1_08133 [Paramyrothecium foliicola]|nr:hypothetical protein HJFPF1_08133 [Paramyrothecium foliicola]
MPEQNYRYMIRNPDSGLMLTNIGHHLFVGPESSFGGYHWECFERDGMLNFRALDSGKYLGISSKGVLEAGSSDGAAAQPFVIREQADGTYELRGLVGNRFRLGVAQIAAMKLQHRDDAWRGEPPHEFMDWEFIKVA